MGQCLDKGIRVVSNAGGLNPKSLVDQFEKVAATLGLKPKIAYIKGVLGDSVSASFRSDPQAKTLGEYLRAKIVDLPESLLT